MKNYLAYVGDTLIAQMQQQKDIMLILPNKRPLAYLQQYMASQLKKAVWFPPVLTIEELVSELSGMHVADPNYTACSLYNIYVETMQDRADSFDDFLKWWKLLITDFNDIDMYLADADSLFGYMNEAKALEQWNPGQPTLTKLQQYYLSFWKYLPVFYHSLNKQLSSENIGYRGMLYRKASQQPGVEHTRYAGHTLFFAGFNALSLSEEKIIEHYLQSQQGYILWEADDYYMKDEHQEAGKFLRYYKQHWAKYEHSIFYCTQQLMQEGKEIHISGAPKSMMQATYAGQLLKQKLQQQDHKLTIALIPADESQLNPLLYELPEEHIKSINISMGYPLLSLPLNGFYQLIFDLFGQLAIEREALFNASLLHRFFSHPYFALLCREKEFKKTTQEVNQLKKKLSSSGKIVYAMKDLQALQNEFQHTNLMWFFKELVHSTGNLNKLMSLLQQVNQQLGNTADLHERHQQLLIYQLSVFNSVLDETLRLFFASNDNLIKHSKTLLQLIQQALQNNSLPFLGDATGGVQFIGLLETRMLQFDELIITGCNEGILPNAKASGNSFIPFEMRYYFKLPTYRDSEAVFAYHFYRILQGAKKIHLIYNTETDEFGSGEMSRFLSQIEKELMLKNKQAKVQHSIIKLPASSNFQRQSISFEHSSNEEKINRLVTERGLSATALISYKNCKLQFYFKYIEKIKEPDEIADEVGANIVGSVIHKVLEEIYSPLKQKKLSIKDITYPTDTIQQMTISAFESIQPGSDANEGKNLLFIQTAVRIILKFLAFERDQLKAGNNIEILHTEAQFEKLLKIENKQVKLIGNVDRIDLYNQVSRIIDYKTGSVDKKKLKIEAVEQLFLPYEYDKAFQLLFYSLLYSGQQGAAKSSISGILSLRKISEGLSITTTENLSELLNDFTQKLRELIANLLNKNSIFDQTEDTSGCSYCAYNNICMK